MRAMAVREKFRRKSRRNSEGSAEEIRKEFASGLAWTANGDGRLRPVTVADLWPLPSAKARKGRVSPGH